MQINDIAGKTGILQNVEIKLYGDNGYGTITNDTDKMYQFIDRANRALDRFTFLAMTADGRWQWDDDNYSTQSIATTNVVSGQREYEFALDHLEIEKVLIKNSAGIWSVIWPFDEQDPSAPPYLENNSNRTGIPIKYDKRGTTLYLDVTPNYNSTSGLKIYFKRGASYFTTADTTKKPGFASSFHSFVPIHIAAHYAIDRTWPQAKSWFEVLQIEEKAIIDYYSKRNKDEVGFIRTIKQVRR